MRLVGILSVVFFVAAGCSQDKPGEDECLVRTGCHVLTSKIADDLLAAQVAVGRGPRARVRHYIDSIDSKFRFDTVIGEYAAQNHIQTDEATVIRRQRQLLRRTPILNKDVMDAVQRLIRDELRAKAVRRAFEESCRVEIPQAEVMRRAGLIAQINEKSTASNVCQYARATNCWMRIRSGELAFVDACRTFDETKNPSPDGAWAELTLDAFEPEERQLRETLSTMQVGDITPPLPGDNGLVIVKLLGRGSGVENDGRGVPAATYRLARIFFHLYEIYPTQTAEELRQDLKRIELAKRWSAFVEQLLAQEEFRYGREGRSLKDWKEKKLKEISKESVP